MNGELPHNFRIFYEREKGGLIVGNDSQKFVDAAAQFLETLQGGCDPQTERNCVKALEGMSLAATMLGIGPLATWLDTELARVK